MSCALLACSLVKECALVGGCVNKRFPPPAGPSQDVIKQGARKLAGEKPARESRDPRFIKRRRKPLT